MQVGLLVVVGLLVEGDGVVGVGGGGLLRLVWV